MDMNFFVKKIQAGLFLSSIDLSNASELASQLKSSGTLPFDGDEVVLPSAPEPGIPRVILRSSDGAYSCNISPVRVDVNYSPSGDVDFGGLQQVNEVKDYLNDVFDYLSEQKSANAYRVTLIVILTSILDNSSVGFLKDKYLKEDQHEDFYEVNLNFLRRSEQDSFEVNQWTRLTSLRKKIDPTNDKGIQIMFDINTLPEKKYPFNQQLINQYYEKATAIVEESLKQIFE